MKEFYNYLKIVKENSQQYFALGTVIAVYGSAYRHKGAKMLFSETGVQYGMISGGCLEEDLKGHADEVIATKKAKKVMYDLRSEDDLGWGQGAGCNGKIEVYLEPINWFDQDENGQFLWPTALSILNKGESIISVREVTEKNLGLRFLFTKEGEGILNTNSIIGEQHMQKNVMEFLGNNELLEYRENDISHRSFIFEHVEAEDTLYIFGAGPDVEPIVQRCSEFHFSPIVIDPSQSRCSPKYFPKAKELVCEHPETYLTKSKIKKDSYVLIMTHSFMKDRVILKHFIHERPSYLGVLGPKLRSERLLNPSPLPDWVHSPVGVNIYAEGADEISISILGQLIQVRNERRKRKRSVTFFKHSTITNY
ncbi:XdhC family protein [Evansella sp. AB-P1]|uniref:XdhC family protein n=1 Tax=Evansella sp. AB-P1 TaxID=3037653 RepID=UPI00241DCE8F|nr:XdhC family protein [Evansella sp. AB-P1]MDG5787912.1 XdhC family protein [Evansella sp. AB-P1]